MPSVLQVTLAGVGLIGPGLDDWATGREALAGRALWTSRPTAIPAPQRLPATERRRASAVAKLSIGAADQAVAASGMAAERLATVFTSASGDPANCHALCEALARPERLVSPTKFTNSVHNATAGYWHIACASRAPSTSLAAYDDSAVAGLLEAMVQCQSLQQPVLMVASEVTYPDPLRALRPLGDALAVALVLRPVRDGSGAEPGQTRLTLGLAPGALATRCATPGLEGLRLSVPSARLLPLLEAHARGSTEPVLLEGECGTGWRVTLSPPTSPAH